MSNKKNSFLMHGSLLALAGLLTRFIGLMYRIPLTRIVGSEGMTYYNVAYEIYNLALLISTYSIPVAVSKLVAAKDAQNEFKNSNRIFKYAMLFVSGIGLAASAVLFIFADSFSAFMEYPSAAIPLRVLAPTIFIFSFMGVIRGFFQGKRTMIPTAISQIVEQIFNAIASVLAAYLLIKAYSDSSQAPAYGAAGGTTGTLVGAIFGLIFLVILYLFKRKGLKDNEKNDSNADIDSVGTIIKAVLLTMLPIILSQTIYQISGIVDIKIFGNIMQSKGFDEKERAILWEAYSNKYKWLYNVPVAVASAFGVSIVPTLASSYSKKDFDGIREKIASSIKFNMLIAFPSAAGLGFLAKPILKLIFEDSNDLYADKLMMLGCVAVVVFGLSTLTNGVLQGISRMRLPVIHSAISLAVHVVLLFVLLYFFDMSVYGLVIGNVTYGLLVCILNAHSIKKILNYKQEILKTFILPAIASLIMGAAALGIYRLAAMIQLGNAVSTVIAIFAAIIIYMLLVIVLGIFDEQELSNMPKGRTLVRIFKKLHLLRK